MTTIQEKTIVFQAFSGKKYGCSPRAIYEQMIKDDRFKDYQFVWAFQDVQYHDFLLQEARTAIVTYLTDSYFEAFARAKYWIVNDLVPVEIHKKPGQVMLQCWHGTPLKRLRTDIIEDSVIVETAKEVEYKNRIDTQRYDYFVSPSRYASHRFIEAFKLKTTEIDVQVLELGYPRNDYLSLFTETDAAQIKRRLKLPSDKKVLLYAPTWRDDMYNEDMTYGYEQGLDFAALQRSLGNSYVLLLRLHSNIIDALNLEEYAGFVYDVSKVDDINELYIVSDILVTDYSSVMFDYAILKRPMLFYMYDKEHYEKDLRGFYLPLDAVPGDIVTTQQELVEILRDLTGYTKRTKVKVAEFSKEYNYLDDGHATERVINKVFFDAEI